MVVLIPTNTLDDRNVYELKRLRKNIKGACEFANIKYVVNAINEYDILHVFSLDQDLLINDAIDNKKPIVVSALMAESDPFGKMCLYKQGKEITLKSKAIKTLNNADIVLVSNESSKAFLTKQGINSEIEILSPGVNLSRFVAINDIEKNLFLRYFGLNENANIILCVGQYDDSSESNKIIEIAKKCPEFTFVFLGKSKKHRIERFIEKLVKRSPKNLIFSDIIEDDVYRSAMINAKIYLSLKDVRFDTVTSLEAMASKTRIISYGNKPSEEEFTKHIIFKNNVDDIANAIKEYGKINDEKELISAYDFAKKYTLLEVSKKLKSIYNRLLNK